MIIRQAKIEKLRKLDIEIKVAETYEERFTVEDDKLILLNDFRHEWNRHPQKSTKYWLIAISYPEPSNLRAHKSLGTRLGWLIITRTGHAMIMGTTEINIV